MKKDKRNCIDCDKEFSGQSFCLCEQCRVKPVIDMPKQETTPKIEKLLNKFLNKYMKLTVVEDRSIDDPTVIRCIVKQPLISCDMDSFKKFVVNLIKESKSVNYSFEVKS